MTTDQLYYSLTATPHQKITVKYISDIDLSIIQYLLNIYLVITQYVSDMLLIIIKYILATNKQTNHSSELTLKYENSSRPPPYM